MPRDRDHDFRYAWDIGDPAAGIWITILVLLVLFRSFILEIRSDWIFYLILAIVLITLWVWGNWIVYKRRRRRAG